jgi:hypothetical protein
MITQTSEDRRGDNSAQGQSKNKSISDMGAAIEQRVPEPAMVRRP